VIGRYEAEAGLRTFSDTKAALGELVSELKNEEADNVLSPDLRYFEVLDCDNRNTIDSALDAFIDGLRAEASFWEDYRRRVESALSKDFRISARIYLLPRHVEQLLPLLQHNADVLTARLDHGELFGELAFARPVFRKHGDSWTIIYEGKVIGRPDSVGLSYIAELLRHPGKAISAKRLQNARAIYRAGTESPLREHRVNVTTGSTKGTDADTADVNVIESLPEDVLDDDGIAIFHAQLAELDPVTQPLARRTRLRSHPITADRNWLKPSRGLKSD
jgi:hypothetical protein